MEARTSPRRPRSSPPGQADTPASPALRGEGREVGCPRSFAGHTRMCFPTSLLSGHRRQSLTEPRAACSRQGHARPPYTQTGTTANVSHCQGKGWSQKTRRKGELPTLLAVKVALPDEAPPDLAPPSPPPSSKTPRSRSTVLAALAAFTLAVPLGLAALPGCDMTLGFGLS